MHRSKACFKCNKTLPLTAFYKHPQMGDGHLNKCIECTKLDVLTHRLNNLEKVRAYDAMRSKTKKRRAQAAKITKRWRKSDKRIMAAHNAVARALRNGDLDKENCEICGSENSCAHHDDYNKPLSVMWLCAEHHKARHAWLAENDIDPYNQPF